MRKEHPFDVWNYVNEIFFVTWRKSAQLSEKYGERGTMSSLMGSSNQIYQ
jgi:hypothetical protein